MLSFVHEQLNLGWGEVPPCACCGTGRSPSTKSFIWRGRNEDWSLIASSASLCPSPNHPSSGDSETSATSPAASRLGLCITAGLVWGGWTRSHHSLDNIPSAAGQWIASAWEQDGEGRSNRKEKALRWCQKEGNCRGGEDEDVWDPLPGRRFNADQMADVCFCDLCGGNMNKLRGSIHPPPCTQCLLQRQGASLLHPGGYSWFLPRSLAPWPKEKALLFRVQGSPAQCGVDESRGFRVQCKTHGKAWKERRTRW